MTREPNAHRWQRHCDPAESTSRAHTGLSLPRRRPIDRAHQYAALRELLSYITDQPFVVGTHGAQAVAIIGDIPNSDELLRSVHDLVHSCDPGSGLHLGIGSAAGTDEELRDSLIRSNHARRAATALGRDLAASEDLTTLNELLAGVPAPVRAAFSARVLGALTEPGVAGLRETLAAFLDHNGSWTKTADALYLHVNTVHYRIERIEKLTGRDLSRLEDRLDLRAALLGTAPEPGEQIRHAC
ncbi:helix-turn-helix domain-containing protein [Nocardia sp. NPDC051463]|uniref:PucR family transcriptional regulator n=1 Tax=Nocardia sp. NPDC051463 TaxID=3154845 RepID=UPI00342F98CC